MGPLIRMLRWAGLPLAFGCAQPVNLGKGFSGELGSALTECAALTGEHRDRCALTALEMNPDLPGETMKSLCVKMEPGAARDRCFEFSIRATPPAKPSVCDEIADERLRMSCRLTAAMADMEGPIAGVAAACDETGPLYVYCLTAVPEHRLPWWRAQGIEVMTEEVAVLVRGAPGIEFKAVFGKAIGLAARSLGAWPDEPGPCDAIPYGAARLACEQALIAGNG